eukprot:scaffold176209_cov50-Attheya_sp.AAC.1
MEKDNAILKIANEELMQKITEEVTALLDSEPLASQKYSSPLPASLTMLYDDDDETPVRWWKIGYSTGTAQHAIY